MSGTVLYSSAFVPPEWIAAHGLEPVRLVPDAGPGTSLLQGICPFAADFVWAASRHPDATTVVLTSTCDQMRRVPERLCRGSRVPVFLMNVPATWHGASRDLYAAELDRLGRFLVDGGGRSPAQKSLVEQMRRFDAWRRNEQAALHQRLKITAQGTRLALLGGPLRRQDFWIHGLLEGQGARIVLDATETGERGQPAPFDPRRLRINPAAELVRAYFDTIPDAFRRPDTLLYDYLRRMCAERAVQGIVLLRFLWCDHWHAQRERFKQCLNLPLVEIDLGDQDHQLQRTRTRLETFLGILR